MGARRYSLVLGLTAPTCQVSNYLNEDELLEVTPESLSIRKMVLDHNMRNREAKRVKYVNEQ